MSSLPYIFANTLRLRNGKKLSDGIYPDADEVYESLDDLYYKMTYAEVKHAKELTILTCKSEYIVCA